MKEINETPQGTLPSPQKLESTPMQQLPGRPGLAQPLGLIPLMVAPARVVAKRRRGETQTLPPSIRKAPECVTQQVPSSHWGHPRQTCPLFVPFPKAQTAPRPPAALSLPLLTLLPPPNTTASLCIPHPENPKHEHKYQSRKMSPQNVPLKY